MIFLHHFFFHCGRFSVINKIQSTTTSQVERFILSHGFWLSHYFELVKIQNILGENIQKSKASHLMVTREQKKRAGVGVSISLAFHTPMTLLLSTQP